MRAYLFCSTVGVACTLNKFNHVFSPSKFKCFLFFQKEILLLHILELLKPLLLLHSARVEFKIEKQMELVWIPERKNHK